MTVTKAELAKLVKKVVEGLEGVSEKLEEKDFEGAANEFFAVDIEALAKKLAVKLQKSAGWE
jgi:hypothetical protein